MKNAYDLVGPNAMNKYFNNSNNMQGQNFGPPRLNPQSSGAYTPLSARNIYSYTPEIENPMSEFSDYKPYQGQNLMMQGMQGLQFGGLGAKLSPSLQKFGTNLQHMYADKFNAANPLAAQKSKVSLEAGDFDLGPAAAVYGLSQNQNPYDYTQTEKIGTLASTAMAAGQLGKLAGIGAGANPMFGMHPGLLIGGLLLGRFFNKKKGDKAKKLQKEAIADVNKQTGDIYTSREEAIQEQRDKMLSSQQAKMYDQREARYGNQYGGNYRADQGMKMNDDIVAEFTGNELIVNDQDALEKDLAQGNDARVASRIRKAMHGGKITPGPETHKNNPMPVDKKGNIYAGGGTLPFKVGKGAGIYDHATDQFKLSMTDKEISGVVKNNINKWKSNDMYS